MAITTAALMTTISERVTNSRLGECPTAVPAAEHRANTSQAEFHCGDMNALAAIIAVIRGGIFG